MFGAGDPARKGSCVLHALLVRTKLKVSFLATGLRSPLVEVAMTDGFRSTNKLDQHPST